MNGTPRATGIEAALELDQAGRFAEAMEALKGASLKGDLRAMTELGHRLLVGDRAPKSAKHALYLLHEAAKKGEARALARVAALTAGGAYLKQDWRQALALLGQAAAAGDASAQGQLTCLQPAGAPPASWQDMAKRVPLNAWVAAAEQEQLHENVRRVRELAPLPVCSWLIERARGRLQPALVYDAVSRENQLHEMRTNTMALFDYSTFDVVQFLLQARMSLTCGYPMQHFETPMVLHYEVGQQITPHFDFIDANAADYAGGETTFPELGIVHRGTAGAGLFFINAHADLTPNRRMIHTGSPPTRGEKWVVSQFIVSKRLRP